MGKSKSNTGELARLRGQVRTLAGAVRRFAKASAQRAPYVDQAAAGSLAIEAAAVEELVAIDDAAPASNDAAPPKEAS